LNITEINQFGKYAINDFTVDNYSVYSKGTKLDIFESRIRQARRELRERIESGEQGLENIEIVFTEESLKTITKNTKNLINQLLKGKYIIDNGYGNYTVNNKRVYCVYCTEKEFNQSKTTSREFNNSQGEFYEYDALDHLERTHYFNYRGYDGKQEISENNKLTPEKYNEYISDKMPQFEIREHDFEVLSIDNSRLDRIYMELKCKICGTTRTVREDVETCTKRVE